MALHAGTALALAARRRRWRLALLAAATAPPARRGAACSRTSSSAARHAAGDGARGWWPARSRSWPPTARRRRRGAADARRRRRAVARARPGGRAGAGRVAQRRDAVGGAGARVHARGRGAELSAEVALPILVGATRAEGRPARAAPPARAARWSRSAPGPRPRALSTAAALRCAAPRGPPPRGAGRALPRSRWRATVVLAVRPARAPQSVAMSGAYATSGVDTGAADRAVGALVSVLKTIDIGRASRSVLESGHYAAVLEIAPNLGIAVGTDGVGSKLIVAEQTGRYDTVGIDCIAMNVNDVICVGAEPIAVLDYIAVERADEDVLRDDRRRAEGGRRGGRRGDPRRRGRRAARADPRPSVAERLRPDGGVLRHRRAGRDRHRRRVPAGRRADRAALDRPALQRLLARPALARRACALDDRPAGLGGARSPTRCWSRP